MNGRAAGALVLLLSACATPVDTVIVVPSAEGKTGTVVVQRGNERHVLDQPYATSRAGEPVTVSPAAEVRQTFGSTLEALPSRPAAFTLYFITGTDELTGESRAELQKVLVELKQRSVPDVVAIGHTDTVGDTASNDRLSAQRAERVKGFLIEIGIPAGRIQTAGRGSRELVVPTPRGVDEPRNRRVEINVR